MDGEVIPDISSLETATLALLRRGVCNSADIREKLAREHGLDRRDEAAWHKFVNNHAWALVRLQSRREIRKVGRQQYELAPPHPLDQIHDGEPLPKWARECVAVANTRNRQHAEKWGAAPPFRADDLVALWKECDGCCRLTGVPFSMTPVGHGAAYHPYKPSLDRINPDKPYTRTNCRLVLQAVNFALNAYGDDVFLTAAEGAIKVRDRDKHD